MRAGRVIVNKIGKQRKVPVDLERAIDPRLTTVFVTEPQELPDNWDFYVTRVSLHHKTEAAAAEMGAVVVTLPEGTAWLAGKVLDMASGGRDVHVFQPSYVGDRA